MKLTLDQIRSKHLAKRSEYVRLYVDEKLSLNQIGKIHGVTKQAVSIALKKAGVTARPVGMSRTEIDRDVLYELYNVQRLSAHAVGSILNASHTLIRKRAAEYGFNRRATDNLRLTFDPEMLRRLYIKEGLTQKQVSLRLGCGIRVAVRELNRYRLFYKDKREAKPKPKPDPTEGRRLAKLYLGERLSIREIGEIFQISRHMTKLLLDLHNIERRKDWYPGWKKRVK
jgi:predicted DNA-binding protein YlxM (UPF0122 family)